jgi:hypothetical protein
MTRWRRIRITVALESERHRLESVAARDDLPYKVLVNITHVPQSVNSTAVKDRRIFAFLAYEAALNDLDAYEHFHRFESESVERMSQPPVPSFSHDTAGGFGVSIPPNNSSVN